MKNLKNFIINEKKEKTQSNFETALRGLIEGDAYYNYSSTNKIRTKKEIIDLIILACDNSIKYFEDAIRDDTDKSLVKKWQNEINLLNELKNELK